MLYNQGAITPRGALAERLRRGLQNLLDEFDSRTCLHEIPGINQEFCFIILLKPSKISTMLEVSGALIGIEQGRLLVLHRNTPETEWWEVPGGKCKPGESHRSAAEREAREELGVDIHITKELGQKVFAPKGVEFRYTYFAANLQTNQPIPAPQEPIHDMAEWMTVDSLRRSHTLSPVLSYAVKQLVDGNF